MSRYPIVHAARYPHLIRGPLFGLFAAAQKLGKGRFMKKTLCLVLAALMAAGPFGPPPRARAQTPPPIGLGPAPLLHRDQLGNLDRIYGATDAQFASLENLEREAVANTILAHGLPTSDAEAVQTWGRDDTLGELFALFVEAIRKPQCTTGQTPEQNGCRTTDEQNAVDWLTAVTQRDAVRAAEAAGLEYVKWAGLGKTAYLNLLATNPSEEEIKDFLYQGFTSARNYAGEVSTCPANTTCRTEDGKTYTEGYCVYQPPAPYQSDYSDRNALDCINPCRNPAGCKPFGPSYDELVEWGAADVHNQLVSTIGYVGELNKVAIGIGFGAATAAVVGGLALIGVAITPAAIWAVGSTTIVTAGTALFPFAATAGVTIAGVASLILIAVVAAIVAGIFAAELFEDEAVPGQLAKFIAGAGSTTPDLPGMLNDAEKLRGLFSLFIGATLPAPRPGTCNSPDVTGALCLNPPPIPAVSPQADPQFKVQLNSGTADAPVLGSPIISSTINWKDTVKNTTATARLTGNWFVTQLTDSAGTSTLQTLRIHYTDWNGKGHTAWLTNFPNEGYKFLGVADQSPSGTPLNATTCLTDNTCSYSPTIKYVGTDGKLYEAQVIPPVLPTLVVTYSPSSPLEEQQVTFNAIGSSAASGTLTYDWQIWCPPEPGVTVLPVCFFTPFRAATGSTVTHTFPLPGNYFVEVKATDSNGRFKTVGLRVPVANVPPKLTLYPACDPLLICQKANVFQVPQGSATTLKGEVTHVGSLSGANIDIDWGDGSAHDVLSCPNGTCTPGIQLGPPAQFTGTHTYANSGKYTVTVKVTDQVGATDTKTVTETVLIVTATTLASSPNPSVVGQEVTYTATVNPAPDGGTVTFLDGGLAIAGCTAQAVAANGTATCTAATGTAASHSVTAVYSGNTTYAKSASSALTQTVNQAATSTSVGSSVNPSVWGQSVTFTATVSVNSPGAGSPTGTVEFKDGGSTISGCATQPVNTSTGKATCTTSALSVSGHSITAAYGGDSNFTGSTSSALTQTVNRASTSTAVSSSKSLSTQGESVTFTATVTVTAPGAGTPTGTVTFKDGATTLGTGTLSTSGGVTTATFATSGLGIGTHSITTSYGGDGNFLPGTSAAITQNVNVDLSKYPKLANGAYNLSNTNLSGAYFIGVSLVGANLSGSNLTGTVFVGANLTGANLSNSNYTSGANFTGANLTGANLSNSNFKGTNFTNANLSGANLTGTTLKGATGLKTATLTGVIWNKTTCPDGTISNQNAGTCINHL